MVLEQDIISVLLSCKRLPPKVLEEIQVDLKKAFDPEAGSGIQPEVSKKYAVA